MLKLLKNAYVRISLYILLFVAFGFLAYFSHGELKICPFEQFLGIICPGCGTSRAFIQILRFNFSEAFALNPFFCAFIFPGAVLVFIQDIIFAFRNFIFKQKKLSFAEFIVESVWGSKK